MCKGVYGNSFKRFIYFSRVAEEKTYRKVFVIGRYLRVFVFVYEDCFMSQFVYISTYDMSFFN